MPGGEPCFILIHQYIFLARDSIQHICLARYMQSTVLPSITQVDRSKTVEVRIMKFSPYSSPNPLVFVGQALFRNANRFPPHK